MLLTLTNDVIEEDALSVHSIAYNNVRYQVITLPVSCSKTADVLEMICFDLLKKPGMTHIKLLCGFCLSICCLKRSLYE